MGTLGCINELMRRDKENRELRKLNREKEFIPFNFAIMTYIITKYKLQSIQLIKTTAMLAVLFTSESISYIQLNLSGLTFSPVP